MVKVCPRLYEMLLFVSSKRWQRQGQGSIPSPGKKVRETPSNGNQSNGIFYFYQAMSWKVCKVLENFDVKIFQNFLGHKPKNF